MKIFLVILVAVSAILILLFVMGRNRLKQQATIDTRLDKMMAEGNYAAVKCMIQSDVVYHDRVALGDEQRQRLRHLDGLVEECDRKIREKNIDEQAQRAAYIMAIIPQIDHVEFGFVLKYCKPDVNYLDGGGNSPLLAACRCERMHIVRLLLENGAKVNSADTEGRTPLTIACNNGNLELVRLMVDKGANVRHRDRSGKKMIQQVPSDAKDFIPIVALLTGAGAETAD